MKQILAGAINRLGDREKIVLTLYYYEGLTLAEIGEVLGVTESRVCQIHTKAVLQLRGRMCSPSARLAYRGPVARPGRAQPTALPAPARSGAAVGCRRLRTSAGSHHAPSHPRSPFPSWA